MISFNALHELPIISPPNHDKKTGAGGNAFSSQFGLLRLAEEVTNSTRVSPETRGAHPAGFEGEKAHGGRLKMETLLPRWPSSHSQ
jgi:hypothetical protein